MPSTLRDRRKPSAIVIGLDSLNGIQTARILARRGVPVIAVAKDREHYGCRTRLCERIIYTDTAGETLIETLDALGRTLAQKAVLFPCTDMTVLLVSRNRQSLSQWYRTSLPAPDVVEMMMDKVGFYTYAQQKGFPIPATHFLKSRTDAERAADELTFPCVLKPPMSATPEWEQNSKLKAYRVFTPAEFLDTYERVRSWSEDLIAQEWVVGPDSSLYSCNCYLDAQSEPLATFVARKLRQWPPVSGESSLGEECRDDVVLQTTVRLFQSVRLHGLGYVEIKQDQRSGKYFILEPNIGRPTGRSAIAEAGGVELLYTMYCDSLGWPLPARRQQSYKGVKWISLRRDLQSAFYHWREGDLTFRQWRESVRGPKAYALFSWSDPGPFLGDLYRAIRLYMIPGERRKRNFRNL